MANETNYRIVGDVTIANQLTSNILSKGSKVDISYGLEKKNSSQRVSLIQSYRPLSKENPFFSVEIHKCDPNAILAIGISSSDLNRHVGLFNNSLGYHSNNGRVYTSWKANANTLGLPFGRGNQIGVYVTYFGEHLSTVLIYYDNAPIATRYHFASNEENFLPTLTFSGGSVQVSVLWPNAVDQLPSIKDIPISQWIRGAMSSYDSRTKIFENRSKLEDLPIQSPVALSKSFRSFIVTQEEISPNDGKAASVGLATFSPLKPSPTCSLMKDYYTWFAKTKMKSGNSIGWGIYFENGCNDDKAEQLCLVFVMFNKTIADALFVLQPEGGFVPIVLLQPFATKISIEKREKLTKDEFERLENYYSQMLAPAIDIYRRDKHERDLSMDLFRTSEQVLLELNDHLCRVTIPKTEIPVHYVQFRQPLTPERRFFFVELTKISDLSQVIVGIASRDHELNEAPGMANDTVGYNSSSGHLFSNRRDLGNMRGHRCRQGETMGVQVEVFGREMSVVLFSKNFRPVGTRYLTLKNHEEFYPTILIENNGDPVELVVYWQNRVSYPTQYNAKNPEDWCLPEKSSVDPKEKLFLLPEHLDHSLCIQGPSSLNKKNNHFEIVLIDKFSDMEPPPAIALCTASPLDPPSTSQFQQDYLRFWPTGDAGKYLQQGDKIGWAILFPQPEENRRGKDHEQLLICYLTINRVVSHVRVLFQPIGGFYPVIIAPPNVNRIKMDFVSPPMSTDDFTTDQIETLLADARFQIDQEKQMLKGSESPIEETNEFKFAENLSNPSFLTTFPEYSSYIDDDNDEPQPVAVQSKACVIL